MMEQTFGVISIPCGMCHCVTMQLLVIELKIVEREVSISKTEHGYQNRSLTLNILIMKIWILESFTNNSSFLL